jgi:hypothetical protein
MNAILVDCAKMNPLVMTNSSDFGYSIEQLLYSIGQFCIIGSSIFKLEPFGWGKQVLEIIHSSNSEFLCRSIVLPFLTLTSAVEIYYRECAVVIENILKNENSFKRELIIRWLIRGICNRKTSVDDFDLISTPRTITFRKFCCSMLTAFLYHDNQVFSLFS